MLLHAIALTITKQPGLLVSFYGMLALLLLFSGVRKSLETHSWAPFYIWSSILLIPALGVLLLAVLAHFST